MKSIYLGGGCFWSVEEYFSKITGVIKTLVGYANGNINNPTYEQVCQNNTNFSEVCMIQFDDKLLSLENILDRFFSIIDPTVLNRQGSDIGTQYRTGIYYTDERDLKTILLSRIKHAAFYKKPILTEILPIQNFYKAEEYHQEYLKKNPSGYRHIKI